MYARPTSLLAHTKNQPCRSINTTLRSTRSVRKTARQSFFRPNRTAVSRTYSTQITSASNILLSAFAMDASTPTRSKTSSFLSPPCDRTAFTSRLFSTRSAYLSRSRSWGVCVEQYERPKTSKGDNGSTYSRNSSSCWFIYTGALIYLFVTFVSTTRPSCSTRGRKARGSHRLPRGCFSTRQETQLIR